MEHLIIIFFIKLIGMHAIFRAVNILSDAAIFVVKFFRCYGMYLLQVYILPP